jgi:2-polyprenyl-3-methyl-5-hydroxy-6-metoxy-1,4-benzoquinol methylase
MMNITENKNDSFEKVREFWNNRPCNIRHSNLPPGSREYFDEVERRKYFVEPHIPAFAEFEKYKGKKVLEIACGIGTDTINFARAGANVTAVDYSQVSLDLAMKRAKVYGLDIKFYCGNAEELSKVVPVEKYDLVYSFGVIHHTPNPKKVLAEIKKYATPASEIKVMVYHKHSWKVFWILMKYGRGAFWKADELIARYAEAQIGCPIAYSYTKKNVKELFDGFEIRDIKIEHIFPYKIPEYKNYKYVKEWYFRFLPAGVFRWLEHKIGWHICVRAGLKD